MMELGWLILIVSGHNPESPGKTVSKRDCLWRIVLIILIDVERPSQKSGWHHSPGFDPQLYKKIKLN